MRVLFFVLAIAALSILFVSCEIEESNIVRGSIYVELHDDLGSEIFGARIYLNGVAQSKVTPDTLSGLVAGAYLIAATKPGYFLASQELTISTDEAATLSLVTSSAPLAAIELVDAPVGTDLIVDNTAVSTILPPVYELSVGTWNVSAYLPDHATAPPARWTVTLAENDTARIHSGFTPLENGSAVGSLAPVFSLPSDLDSAIFRLQDYRGRIVLLSFFFYDCVPCLDEFPHIQAVYADNQYAGWLEFFGVNGIDPWFRLNTYKEGHPSLGIQFPLLWDRAGEFRTQHYDVAVHPTNFLIDPTGTIRYRWGSISEGQLRGAIEALIDEFDEQN